MFDWRNRDHNLDPYFRAVYIVQFIAAWAVLAGFFLIWWNPDHPASDPQTLFHLLDRSLDMLADRDPHLIGQPLIVLWLLWPDLFAGLLRGFTGILVQPVEFRILAAVAWIAAMLTLGHFYINFGEELAEKSPLKNGSIGAGFWLTASSVTVLGLLILTEFIIRKPDPTIFRQKPPSGAVDDAQRLWEGDYQTCPHCGMINEPDARACYNCRNLLFSFGPEKEEK
ncbi:MAG: hypothetical protein JXA10_15330 [Anaerolineae bacterium]|nr:hypothetical protein [Anaerolineae bacterium]